MPFAAFARRVFVVLAAAVSGTSAPAWAHGALIASTPKSGEVLAVAPTEIRLRFNEALESAFSSITVVDANAREVVADKPGVDLADVKTLILRPQALSSGVYDVRWSVVTRDGHRTKGSYRFTVR